MRALSLFSGIGGLDIAAHAAGIETVAFCEIEPFACQILAKRFPGVPIINDVREVIADGSLGTIDVVHGGFPCQDLSVAGKQRGLSGDRSGLWYEMLRVVSELRPAYVLAENVRGACNLALPTVVSGLERAGYEVRASVVPASAFGAPHKRERLFVLGVKRDVADAIAEGLQRGEWRGALLEQGASAPEPTTERGEGSLWPTPSVCGNYNRRGLSENSGDGLATAVKMWPTPRANKPEGYSSDNFRPTLAQCATGEKTPLHGQLSPAWVECLMNFPLGWTDPDCDEPEPWPGWPAMMGESFWRTPQASEGEHGGPNARDSAGGAHLSSQVYAYADQYPYEPPRTCTGIPHRAKRLKALGNAVIPAQAFPFFEAIRIMEEVRRWNTK